MKKYILTVIFTLGTLVCFALEQNNVQFPEASFRNINTPTFNSGHDINITPVGSTSINQTTQNVYVPSNVRRVEHPYDPFFDPIGDVPWIFMTSLIILFILLTKYKKRRVD